jgi:hypothetical protein
LGRGATAAASTSAVAAKNFGMAFMVKAPKKVGAESGRSPSDRNALPASALSVLVRRVFLNRTEVQYPCV